MTPTLTSETRIAATLQKRIRQFYEHLNHEEFDKCYQMIDPCLRQTPATVTLYQYASSLERFLRWCGGVKVTEIGPIHLHLNEPNRQYGNRDFAQVEISWADSSGQQHTFKERWVRDRRGRWFTRGTGFMTPATE